MASAREMRLRIRSIKSIAQVTRALQTVSASKVRRAVLADEATRPYSEKAWHVLIHLAKQPGRNSLHPLLKEPAIVQKVLVILITSDRGLAGAYNMNVVRSAMAYFKDKPYEMRYVAVGRKGRDMLIRRRRNVIAEFSNLPAKPTFTDVSAIGRLAIDDFLSGEADQVYLAYTSFKSMIRQEPRVVKLLPLSVEKRGVVGEGSDKPETAQHGVFTYEPDQTEILDQIIRRFTSVQVYQAILESTASEHAARMMAMQNATDSANELTTALLMEYNKARQQSITNEMIDISGGAEALSKSVNG
jgi:F-type H+-transporting ATPase subunit gamma